MAAIRLDAGLGLDLIILRFVYMLFFMDIKDANIVETITHIVNKALCFLSLPSDILRDANHIS